MKKLALMAVLLCSCAIACNREDTDSVDVWPRSVEPRLTGMPWAPCTGPECGRKKTDADEDCPELVETHSEAVTLLAERPRCTDVAIRELRTFTSTEPGAWSDIAAAYYLRAFRESRQTDLLLALKAAEDTVAATPGDAAARFNLALIHETLGLSDLAIASWNAFLMLKDPDWSQEGRDRLGKLQSDDAATRWHANQQELPEALRGGDRGAVAKLIEGFAGPATDYLERSQLSGAEAKLLASEISTLLNGDHYALDVADAMPRAHEGHAAFAEGDYAQAAELLRRAGSPAYVAARIEQAQILASADNARALAIFESVHDEAKQYWHLHARWLSGRAFVRFTKSDHLRALSDYEMALEMFLQLGDTEKVASIRRSIVSSHRTLGQLEMAWTEAMSATRDLRHVVDSRRRQTILMETADTALALGYPEIALSYVEAIFTLQSRDFKRIALDSMKALDAHKNHVAAAHRLRAKVEIILKRSSDAGYHLREAERLSTEPLGDEEAARIQRTLRIRFHEVKGQSLMPFNAAGAANAFTDAIGAIEGTELKTLRASLYAQRAEANALAGRSPESDLENALHELREEETQMLANRERGEGEEYWTGYFARFDDVYDRLVRQAVSSGQWQKAFDYDERSRGYEPLDLILKLDTTPAEFRKLVPGGEPMNLAAVRSQLPPGTVLLQYAVLDDRTYTWIVRREGAARLEQLVSRSDVQRWSETIHRSVSAPGPALQQTLRAAYDGLLAKPLNEATRIGPKAERLVIVPDGPMHGLPFSALYDTRAGEYVMQKAPIEIAGSATLYVYSLIRDRTMAPDAPRSVLLIGDPAYDEKSRLRGAATEVREIAAFYARRWNVAVRTGSEATLSAFLALAADRGIIHFGGHSVVDARRPWSSALHFAKTDEHTGAITAEELVRRLELDRTRLVVLASCSSADGRPVGPEGVAPLVRPLITAGVPAVVGTLWDVGDATTKPLAVSFHRHYEQSGDAAKALQAAQVEMLGNEDRGLQTVLAWAPFQVVGHASTPFVETQKRTNGGIHLGIHRTHSLQRDDGLHPQQ